MTHEARQLIHPEFALRAGKLHRADSPLRYDDSYTVVDTSDLDIPAVVNAIVNGVRART